VKFGALIDHLTQDPGFSDTPWLATGTSSSVSARLGLTQLFGMFAGHYASKDWKYHNGVSRPRLIRSCDVTKDQTYYLSSVPERSLARALFPLGNLKKTEVRELAAKWSLPTAAREESMGICFVGEKRKFHDFICELHRDRFWYILLIA